MIMKGGVRMAKNETKNIITKEAIEKELKFLNKADIRSSLVLIAVMALILCRCRSYRSTYSFLSAEKQYFLGSVVS